MDYNRRLLNDPHGFIRSEARHVHLGFSRDMHGVDWDANPRVMAGMCVRVLQCLEFQLNRLMFAIRNGDAAE